MQESTVKNTGAASGAMLMVRAMRPRQWLKNLLIFVPVLTAHSADLRSWRACVIAFVAFCLCASSAYLLNDVLDIRHDRLHPRKRMRPIAAGTISRASALCCSLLLGAAGVMVAAGGGISLLKVVCFYFILTVLYSFYLKKVLLIDVAMLAGLYTIRIIGGSAATEIQLSFWLLSYSFFLFLSLALLKRHNELVRLKEENLLTVPGRGYLPADSTPVAIFGISSGVISALVLMLYYNSGDVAKLYPSPLPLFFVVPLFFIWIARLWLLSFRMQIDEDPLLHVSTDPASITIILICIGLAGLATL
ncbi:UbiA family prenyltransferase [Burkholderia sp. LMU1-1-1.1]|uniref:UbiA family prenyltransferase n=1 Tax=Burkholderia sp. LMU1-1-1.1 TaxID=3135266 RepID=UPI00344358D7